MKETNYLPSLPTVSFSVMLLIKKVFFYNPTAYCFRISQSVENQFYFQLHPTPLPESSNSVLHDFIDLSEITRFKPRVAYMQEVFVIL